MSKTSKRKGGGESGKSSGDGKASSIAGSGSEGVSSVKRQSVFERLGNKTASSRESIERCLSSAVVAGISQPQPQSQVTRDSELCRSWIKNGACPFGKSCKLAFSHSLISPSKRSISKEIVTSTRRPTEEEKQRILLSAVVRGGAPDSTVSWDCWDQNDLEYEDEKALEKRRALLQRELKLQMKKEGGRKEPMKRRSSSTSSASSSTSNTSSSSVSSSSSGSIVREKTDNIKRKRQSTSSQSDTDKPKKLIKTSARKDSPGRKFDAVGSSRGRNRSIDRKKPLSPPVRKSSSKRRSLSPPSRKLSPKTSRTASSSSVRRRETPASGRRISPREARRSPSRGRRRSPTSIKSSSSRKSSRPRSPEVHRVSSSGSRALGSSRGRSTERRKEDDRRKDDPRRDRKSDYRDKREDSRNREKARELREVAREKERSEALERCRERQREREQKEKDRLRDERERKSSGNGKRGRSSVVSSSDKRHDRSYDRYEGRSKGSERERSFEKERVRDRALERVMERRPSDPKRDRSRDSYGGDRYAEHSRRLLPSEDKHYSSSPYRSDRNRYEADRLSPREDRVSGRSYVSDERRPERPRVAPGRQDRGGSTVRYEDPPSREKVSSGSVRSDFRERSPSRAIVPPVGAEWDVPSGSGGAVPVEDWSSGPQATDWLRTHPHLEERRERSRDKESSNDRDAIEQTLLSKRLPLPPLPPRPDDDMDDALVAPGSASSSNKSAPLAAGPSAAKKSRLDPDPELSDISDDPDDILNQDDDFSTSDAPKSDTPAKGSDLNSTTVSNGHEAAAAQRLSLSSNIDSRIEDDPMDASFGDFEEISDEELEEEKVLKGSSVGDALGVDWASLMAECKPNKRDGVEVKDDGEHGGSDLRASSSGGVRRLWEASAIFARSGISLAFTGPEVYKKLQEKYPESLQPVEDKPERPSCVNYLKNRLAKMKEVRNAGRFNSITDFLCHKRALSARSDIAIRRQLCGLPLVTLETHQNTGFVQWAV